MKIIFSVLFLASIFCPNVAQNISSNVTNSSVSYKINANILLKNMQYNEFNETFFKNQVSLFLYDYNVQNQDVHVISRSNIVIHQSMFLSVDYEIFGFVSLQVAQNAAHYLHDHTNDLMKMLFPTTQEDSTSNTCFHRNFFPDIVKNIMWVIFLMFFSIR